MRKIGTRNGSGESKARERLLTEAFVLFYLQGIRAVGIDLLINRSGVAKATFYRHFPSKDDLVLTYLDRRQHAWLTWLREFVEMRDPGDRLLAVFDALEELFSDSHFRGSATINAVAEVGEDSARVVGSAQRYAREFEAYLADLASHDGRERPLELAQQLVLLVDGAIVSAQRSGNSKSARLARAAAERLID